MSTHKYIDRICVIGLVCTLLITVLFMNGAALGIQSAQRVMGYEQRLFDTSRVHTIDIVMDDWDGFLATCRNEEYSVCSVVIDGEAYKNVGIRGKGNTSLSTVASMDSDRYSFKIEFDQYDSTKSYHGLDKLCLNNIIQDATYMKDYLSYRLMGEFDAAAPLCSYAYITVNGEDWGLYLAVEAVEDSFLQRNYGAGYGDLYKPDSMSFGGGRGNGKDFNMEDFLAEQEAAGEDGNPFVTQPVIPGETGITPQMPDGQIGGMFPGGNRGEFDPSAMQGGMMPGVPGGEPGTFDPFAQQGGNTGGLDPAAGQGGTAPAAPDGNTGGMNGRFPNMGGDRFNGGGMGGNMGGGRGSSDVMLQYTDDDPASYSNIFSSAKTDVTDADEARLIAALKALGAGDAESAVDIDAVLRYFVVHNFVVNGDSYTGSMIHNYYLYEEDGKLAMIPWDYNLAFGTFQGSDAQSAVNDPIDSPLSVTGSGDRPMADWIFSNAEYTALYHQYFAEFLQNVDITAIIDEAAALIAPYVEKDPTAFCSYEEFQAGAAALREFCRLRTKSVRGQLDGVIPSTDAGQQADSSALVDTSGLDLAALGSMGMGGGMGGNRGDRDNAVFGETGRQPGTTRPENIPGAGFSAQPSV